MVDMPVDYIQRYTESVISAMIRGYGNPCKVGTPSQVQMHGKAPCVAYRMDLRAAQGRGGCGCRERLAASGSCGMLIRKTRRDAMHELISDVTIKTASSACGSRRIFVVVMGLRDCLVVVESSAGRGKNDRPACFSEPGQSDAQHAFRGTLAS